MFFLLLLACTPCPAYTEETATFTISDEDEEALLSDTAGEESACASLCLSAAGLTDITSCDVDEEANTITCTGSQGHSCM